MRITLLAVSLSVLTCSSSFSQQRYRENVDTAAVQKIWREATEESHIMEILYQLTDVTGPRLTGSPQYAKAAQWATKVMDQWGIANLHLEGWGPFGRSWSLKEYSATVTAPDVFPLISYPKAWSPGVEAEAEAVLFTPKTDSALATFMGKLKGRYVLLDEPRNLSPEFEPRASRKTDSTLLEMANANFPRPRRNRFEGPSTPEEKKRALFNYKKVKMLSDEGALAILTASRSDGGTIFVQGASVLAHPDTPYAHRPKVQQLDAPKTLPQIQVAAEHYNRLARLLQHGDKVRIDINLAVSFPRADSVYNVIGEIRGNDLKDEIVMIGAHLDSWHGGTGTTDNATGSSVCLEVMRILKSLDVKPRRTIRIGLWSAEEQGLLGSAAHVKKYYGEPSPDGKAPILKPAAEKFSAYFNLDNGTGRIRGIYMQGNEAVRTIFRSWLTAAGDPAAETLTLNNTGSTDHMSFDRIGLPAFQFIQDEVEYGSFTWHSTMDVYDRVVEKDVQQAAAIMAIFAYHAAMRDEKLPRKPSN